MIHDDCNMAEEVNFQQATRAICCINIFEHNCNLFNNN